MSDSHQEQGKEGPQRVGNTVQEPHEDACLTLHVSADENGETPGSRPATGSSHITDSLIGSVLENRYHLVSVTGRGATSTVYGAHDRKHDAKVAIKVLHSHLTADSIMAERFGQEAKTSSLLQHPNIVDVRSYNKTNSGAAYLVMEYVEGTSLHDAIQAAGWLPVPRALAVFVQLCAALAAAHEKGIVHRDLKPGNIMLTKGSDGNLLVKVLDFGIAKVLPAQGDTLFKLTQSGETLGSLLYMSPEQCLDRDVDGRSDCYSLGCVLYETLTGKPPLSARTAFETMNKQISEIPERLERVRPDLNWPNGLQEVLFKALAKDPNKRYQSIGKLQDDLMALSTGNLPAPVETPQIVASSYSVAGTGAAAELAGFIEKERRELKRHSKIPPPAPLFALLAIGAPIAMSFRLPALKEPVFTVIAIAVLSLVNLIIVIFLLRGRDRRVAAQNHRLQRTEQAVSAIENTNPKRMLLARGHCKKVLPTDLFFGGAIEESLFLIDELLPTTANDLPIKNLIAIPVSLSAQIWENIAEASKLGELAPPDALPIPADVYFDNGKAIAVQVRGNLAIIVSDN